MRRHSFTGPLLLVIIGGLFLWHNVHPEAPIFDLVALYWPYALIAWGVLRLIEVVASRGGRYAGLSGGEIALIGVLSMQGEANPMPLMVKGASLRGIFVGSAAMARDLNAFVDAHQLKPVVDRVFDFTAAKAAYAYQASRELFGKVVIANP